MIWNLVRINTLSEKLFLIELKWGEIQFNGVSQSTYMLHLTEFFFNHAEKTTNSDFIL